MSYIVILMSSQIMFSILTMVSSNLNHSRHMCVSYLFFGMLKICMKKIKDYYANLNTNASPVITAYFIDQLKFQSVFQ